MSLLYRTRVMSHQCAVEILRGRADVLCDFGGQLQSSKQNLRRFWQDLVEQITKAL